MQTSPARRLRSPPFVPETRARSSSASLVRARCTRTERSLAGRAHRAPSPSRGSRACKRSSAAPVLSVFVRATAPCAARTRRKGRFRSRPSQRSLAHNRSSRGRATRARGFETTAFAAGATAHKINSARASISGAQRRSSRACSEGPRTSPRAMTSPARARATGALCARDIASTRRALRGSERRGLLVYFLAQSACSRAARWCADCSAREAFSARASTT